MKGSLIRYIGITAAILAIIGGGFFLRFNDLGKQSYWMDEGYTVNAVISGMQNGTKNFAEILDSGDPYSCPIYCAPTKLIVRALANGRTVAETASDAIPFRLLSVVAGLLVIGLFALIAKKIFKSNSVAILAAFFTTFSYWQIAWSRNARWYTLYELFFWLAMLFAYLATEHRTSPPALSLNKKRGLYIFLSLVSAALATLTHNLGYGLFVIIAIYLAIYLLPDRITHPTLPYIKGGEKTDAVAIKISKPTETEASYPPLTVRGGRWGYVGGIFLILVAIAIPAFIIEAATGFKFSHAVLNRVSLHYVLPYYLNFYLKNYWFLIILSFYGFFSAPKEQKKAYWLVFLPILGYLAALGLLTDIVHYRYMFAPIGGILITSAAGAVAMIKAASNYVIARRPQPTRQSHPPTAIIALIIIVTIFFLSGEGIITPKNFYTLESDSNKNPNRPYWGYTPQPNFNAAYSYIEQNLKEGEIVIASHPHFNKIFLNQPGYWIKYDYLGLSKEADTVKQNKEHYVGATVINNLDELKKIMNEHHGYITLDFMSQDNRIPLDVLNYISQNATQVFSDTINDYSKIWVYKF